MSNIIEVDKLKKSYGRVDAVKGISFYAERGKLLAFLGPNGAGKSTTIDMICTFLKPDGGEVTVNNYRLGKDDDKIRRSIGAVFQDSLLDRLLTVEENMLCRGALYGMSGKRLAERAQIAMDTVGIKEYARRPYGQLSGGQRRRCDIARALVHTPEILFLDEPTTGLDPQARKAVWEIIRRLQRENGMTVFLTTHYMEEAAGADYVIVVDDGQIAAKGTPLGLRETYACDRLQMSCRDMSAVTSILEEGAFSYEIQADQAVVKIGKTLDALPVLDACQAFIHGFEVTRGTMDDAFIEITGKELRQ